MKDKASLAGCRCPYCKRDLLRFDPHTRVNTCPGCGGEVVTEEEYLRRLAAEQQREAVTEGASGYVLAQAVPNAVGGLVAAVAHRLIWRRDGGGPTT